MVQKSYRKELLVVQISNRKKVLALRRIQAQTHRKKTREVGSLRTQKEVLALVLFSDCTVNASQSTVLRFHTPLTSGTLKSSIKCVFRRLSPQKLNAPLLFTISDDVNVSSIQTAILLSSKEATSFNFSST